MAPLLDKYYSDTRKNSPLVYYRMREGSGTTMIDSSSNANNGTYNGSGVSWQSQSGSFSTGYAVTNGKNVPIFNSHHTTLDYTTNPTSTTTNPSVLAFDGAAGRATATLSSPAINTSASSIVTVEMWVKWDGVLAGSNGTYEALANFAGATGILLGFLKNGASDYRFGVSVRNAGDLWGLSNATTLAVLQRDVYHHIVFVLVNNAIQTSKLYIDGRQYTMTQQIGTTTTTDSVTSAFALGYDGTASFYQGHMSEVAVYNGELYNATGVENRYYQGAYGSESTEFMQIPGLESRIEIGSFSFTINDKDNPGQSRTMNNYYISDIGGMDDADIRFNEESNFYRDGTNPLTSKYGGRTITMTGKIEAQNVHKMRQMQTELKYNLGTNFETPVVFRNVWNNGSDFMLNMRKNTSLQMAERQDSYLPRRDFLITMRSSYPFFESAAARTDIVIMGATLALPNRGNTVAYPSMVFWGPFTEARLTFGGVTFKIVGTVAVSTFVNVDSKNRTCSNWPFVDPTSDFPSISAAPGAVSDQYITYANFASVTGGTAGVTRVEITWKHTML